MITNKESSIEKSLECDDSPYSNCVIPLLTCNLPSKNKEDS